MVFLCFGPPLLLILEGHAIGKSITGPYEVLSSAHAGLLRNFYVDDGAGNSGVVERVFESVATFVLARHGRARFRDFALRVHGLHVSLDLQLARFVAGVYQFVFESLTLRKLDAEGDVHGRQLERAACHT